MYGPVCLKTFLLNFSKKMQQKTSDILNCLIMIANSHLIFPFFRICLNSVQANLCRGALCMKFLWMIVVVGQAISGLKRVLGPHILRADWRGWACRANWAGCRARRKLHAGIYGIHGHVAMLRSRGDLSQMLRDRTSWRNLMKTSNKFNESFIMLYLQSSYPTKHQHVSYCSRRVLSNCSHLMPWDRSANRHGLYLEIWA